MPTDADPPSADGRPRPGGRAGWWQQPPGQGDLVRDRREDHDDEPSGPSLPERLARWVRPTPGELVGVSLLVCGSLVATLVWWGQSVTGPAALDEVLSVGAAIGAEGTTDGPAPARGAVRPGEQPSGGGVGRGGGVHLAREFVDGEQVHLPSLGEAAVGTVGPGGPPPSDRGGTLGAVGADGLIDLNVASAAELEQLPGIGPARAAAIVEFRERDGPFAVPGDLREVAGIGEATFQTLAPLVVVR